MHPRHSVPSRAFSTRLPAQLLVFYLEESGFGNIAVEYVNPAAETMAEVQCLPAEFQKKFFGGLDYAVSATRL